MIGIIDPADAACHMTSLRRPDRTPVSTADGRRTIRRPRHPLAFLARVLTAGPGTANFPTPALG